MGIMRRSIESLLKNTIVDAHAHVMNLKHFILDNSKIRFCILVY
jgi:hypothetical protein